MIGSPDQLTIVGEDTTKTTVTITPNITPEQIMNEVIEGAAAHAAATESFASRFMFYGKPLKQWSDELAVAIPSEPKPAELRDIYVRIANNIQIASHFHSLASSISSTLVGGGQIKKADLIRSIVDQYEGNSADRPAGTIITSMADSYMRATTSTRVAAKLVKDFWKQRLDTLVEVRKNCEQISMSMHTEMKYLMEHQGE